MQKIIDTFDLTGRSALVTGAASGIGLAYAEALAEAGAIVTLTDLDGDKAQSVAEAFRQRGWQARVDQLDVTRARDVAAAFDRHAQACGGLDIAFANAGVGIGNGWLDPDGNRLEDGQIDNVLERDWQKTVDVNLNGVHHTISNAARIMKRGGRPGSIVATTSNASRINVPIVCTAYMAAKAGVAHLVRNVALELARYRIRVNAIAPGSFVTNIGNGILHVPEVRKAWDARVPLGAMAETSQMKPLALFLASDASSFVTGTEVVIDGGVSLTNGYYSHGA